VAKLLEKPRIEKTTSRSRHNNNNASAKIKNASVVKKTHGLQPHSEKYAKPINALYHQ
tara:strand:+ start:426 stop:599 length:174 start_codon:yes stop_codon:yes gene_type:complete